MIKVLWLIVGFIRYNFWWFLVRPVRKLVNYHIHGLYMEDNERTRGIIEYCEKIVHDPDYEPSTPVEHWVDMEWQERSKELYAWKREEGLIGEDEPYDYRLARPVIARSVFKEIAETVIVKAA